MLNVISKCYEYANCRLGTFKNNQDGVTAIEYALIAVAMATLLAAVLGNQDKGFLGALNDTFEAIAAAIQSVTVSAKS